MHVAQILQAILAQVLLLSAFQAGAMRGRFMGQVSNRNRIINAHTGLEGYKMVHHWYLPQFLSQLNLKTDVLFLISAGYQPNQTLCGLYREIYQQALSGMHRITDFGLEDLHVAVIFTYDNRRDELLANFTDYKSAFETISDKKDTFRKDLCLAREKFKPRRTPVPFVQQLKYYLEIDKHADINDFKLNWRKNSVRHVIQLFTSDLDHDSFHYARGISRTDRYQHTYGHLTQLEPEYKELKGGVYSQKAHNTLTSLADVSDYYNLVYAQKEDVADIITNCGCYVSIWFFNGRLSVDSYEGFVHQRENQPSEDIDTVYTQRENIAERLFFNYEKEIKSENSPFFYVYPTAMDRGNDILGPIQYITGPVNVVVNQPVTRYIAPEYYGAKDYTVRYNDFLYTEYPPYGIQQEVKSKGGFFIASAHRASSIYDHLYSRLERLFSAYRTAIDSYNLIPSDHMIYFFMKYLYKSRYHMKNQIHPLNRVWLFNAYMPSAKYYIVRNAQDYRTEKPNLTFPTLWEGKARYHANLYIKHNIKRNPLPGIMDPETIRNINILKADEFKSRNKINLPNTNSLEDLRIEKESIMDSMMDFRMESMMEYPNWIRGKFLMGANASNIYKNSVKYYLSLATNDFIHKIEMLLLENKDLIYIKERIYYSHLFLVPSENSQTSGLILSAIDTEDVTDTGWPIIKIQYLYTKNIFAPTNLQEALSKEPNIVNNWEEFIALDMQDFKSHSLALETHLTSYKRNPKNKYMFNDFYLRLAKEDLPSSNRINKQQEYYTTSNKVCKINNSRDYINPEKVHIFRKMAPPDWEEAIRGECCLLPKLEDPKFKNPEYYVVAAGTVAGFASLALFYWTSKILAKKLILKKRAQNKAPLKANLTYTNLIYQDKMSNSQIFED